MFERAASNYALAMPDDDREHFENLLSAAHRFADACEARLSEDQLEKLRDELADALKQMDEDAKRNR
jgi:DNA-binding MurR/RpiR family transcriptional regulator